MTDGAGTDKATKLSPSVRSDEEQPIRKVAYQDEMKFLFCVLGIYGSYFLFGYLQEELNLQKFGPEQKKFKNVAFLVFVQCVGNSFCAFFARKIINDKQDSTPFVRYAVISATYVGAMWSSNYAIQFVSYPFMVLAKSCKPIPVLFMGVLVFGKKQGWIKYLCVFLVTLGITIFMSDEIQNSKSGAETSAFGVLLLCMSLAMDGVTGPFQDHLVHQYKPSSTSMMLSTNLWASIYLGIGLLVTGHGKQGIEFVLEYPEVLPHIVLYSVSSAIGQNFIYYTINHFGSLACSLITTTRKFFTILISVMIFGPMLSEIEWIGVGVVFIGLGIDIYISATNKRKKVD